MYKCIAHFEERKSPLLSPKGTYHYALGKRIIASNKLRQESKMTAPSMYTAAAGYIMELYTTYQRGRRYTSTCV